MVSKKEFNEHVEALIKLKKKLDAMKFEWHKRRIVSPVRGRNTGTLADPFTDKEHKKMKKLQIKVSEMIDLYHKYAEEIRKEVADDKKE